MTKLKQITIISLGILSLSACSGMESMMGKSTPKASDQKYYYYSQTVPVRAQGYVDTLDLDRYSAAHIQQSSYMFK